MQGDPAFLAGGGELAALVRAKDWAATPLGPPDALAAEPEDRGADHADLPPADLDRLGRGADLPLQRRVQGHHRRQAPLGARPAGRGGLAGDLGRHRPDAGHGDERGRGHLRRGAAPHHGAQRLPGGDLLHLLLQPGAQGRGRHGRHHLRQHRRHAARHRRAPARAAAGPGRRHGRRAQLAAGLRAERRRAGDQPARPSLRDDLHGRAGRAAPVARRARPGSTPGHAAAPASAPLDGPSPWPFAEVLRHPRDAPRRRPGGALRGRAADRQRLASAAGAGGHAPDLGGGCDGPGRCPRRRPQPVPPVRRGLPAIPRPGGGPDLRGHRQRATPTRTSAAAPRRWPRSTGPRRRSSPTSATSSARRSP